MNEQLDVKKDEAPKDAKKVKEVQSPVKSGLKTKEAIVANWLPRYTGRPLDGLANTSSSPIFLNTCSCFPNGTRMHP
jgi:hypothetical protein